MRSIRHHNFLRTNQFLVDEQLQGLEERFSVQGREGLAAALKQRLETLEPLSNKWTPDILHFLLELSDKPTHKSRLEDLELLRDPEEGSVVNLRWEDIAREDGWRNEQDIWKDADYTDSSDEDGYQEVQSDKYSDSEDTSLSSVAALHQRTAHDLVVQAGDDSLLERVRQSQSWRAEEASKDDHGRQLKVAVSEFQTLREVLFMLSGLPSSLFDEEGAPVPRYQLSNVSWDAYWALITSFAEHGRRLLALRVFSQGQQQVPLLQVFQDCISNRLLEFDQHIARIQHRFVAINQDTVVSLIAILEELKPSLAPLSSLGGILQQLQAERYAHAFRYLELIYDAVSLSQLRGDNQTYHFLGKIFFECFQVYLRPMRLWMEDGQLVSGDKTFFVSSSSASVPLNQVWEGQFKLRRTQDGVLHAPKFLQPAVRKIFNTGKSVVVLKHLGRYHGAKQLWSQALEPPLDFGSVCPPDSELAPFSELFNNAFERWVQSKHHATSATLQSILFESCGLWSSLEALQHIYFMTDGSVSDSFTLAVFKGLDSLNTNWHDRFTLSEFAQAAWASRVDEHRISAAFDIDGTPDGPISARSSVKSSLSRVRLHYRLPWPVQLVLTRDNTAGYQRVFTLLLQLRRATYFLKNHRLLNDMATGSEASEEQAVFYAMRTKLLWFCATYHSYLTSQVLMSNVAQMRENLHNAEDIDAMISAHTSFVKRVTDEACLGRKLDPIRDCILDVLDLSIKLEDARRAQAMKEQADFQEISRLSMMSSPTKTPRRSPAYGRRAHLEPKQSEEDDGVSSGEEDAAADLSLDLEQSYSQVLVEIRADFDRHLRFLVGGLRGVARATSDPASVKWDTLAEMLEFGILTQR